MRSCERQRATGGTRGTVAPFTAGVAAGVTLIELSAVLVALAIAAAIAIPAWRNNGLHAGRAVATRGLAAIQEAEERTLVREGHYAPSLEAPPPAGLGLASRSADGRYRFELEVVPGGFTARARALAAGPDDPDPHCRLLSLNDRGLQHAEDGAGTDSSQDCWR